MFNARKSIFLSLVLISVFALTSLVFAEATKIKGDIAGMDLNSQTMLLSTSEGFVQLNLAGSVLKRNGMGILPEEFQVGERVSATYEPSTMNAIEVNTKGGYVEGFITDIETARVGYLVTITGIKNKPITVQVNLKTSMTRNDELVKVFSYEIGDYAKAVYQPKLMIALKIAGWSKAPLGPQMISAVKGFLVKIEFANTRKEMVGRITLSVTSGELVAINVAGTTKIELNGTPCQLKDLLVGDFVVASTNPTGFATSISATRSEDNLDLCTGYIVSIRITGDLVPFFEIVVRTNEYSKVMVFNLPIGAEVWKDGKRAKGFALKSGDFAKIVYEETRMDIVKIEAWTATK